MKIGIYNECSRGETPFDGSERYSLQLASALASPQSPVEFVHHKPQLNGAHLARFAAVDTTSISFRFMPIVERVVTSKNPRRRFEQERDWGAKLSQPYDLFVCVGHQLPPFCHARRGLLIALFPIFNPTYLHAAAGDSLRKRLERPYHRWEWQQRMSSYALHVGISDFVTEAMKARWNVTAQVLYPAVDSEFERVETANKDDLILSVGRFSTFGVQKRQWEMMQTFARLRETGLPNNWNYYSTGGCGAFPEENEYCEKVRALGATVGAEVEPNLPWPQLKHSYERAKIFWHAAGFGAPADQPAAFEHFGIVTLEAMAAGAVPVVINRGGQSEIVQHGVNGFLWNTLDELAQYTLELTRKPELLQQMSEAARQRATKFDRVHFQARVRELFAAVL